MSFESCPSFRFLGPGADVFGGFWTDFGSTHPKGFSEVYRPFLGLCSTCMHTVVLHVEFAKTFSHPSTCEKCFWTIIIMSTRAHNEDHSTLRQHLTHHSILSSSMSDFVLGIPAQYILHM